MAFAIGHPIPGNGSAVLLDYEPSSPIGSGICLVVLPQGMHHPFATYRYERVRDHTGADERVDLYYGEYHADLTGAVRSLRGRCGKAV